MTLCSVLLLCNLVFIWGNSLLPAEVSGQISGTLKALLDGVFTPGEAVPSGGDGLLRKCAHFAEFGALGLLLGWLFGMLGKKRLPAFALGENVVKIGVFEPASGDSGARRTSSLMVTKNGSFRRLSS